MVDLTFLQQFTKGNETKMKRYIGIYLQVAPETFDRMKTDIQSQNWADLAINAHSLKPQVDYMVIPALKEILMQIEDGVKNGETAGLPALYEKAQQLHREAAVILSEKIEEM